MDRASSLVYLHGFADQIYRSANRPLTDTSDGYGPAIDEAIRTIVGQSSSLSVYTVPDASLAAFRAALRYYALDIVEWNLLSFADNQVDAPLTNVKLSQILPNVRAKKSQALSDLVTLGYGPSNVSWVRWTFDYLEPSGLVSEYA